MEGFENYSNLTKELETERKQHEKTLAEMTKTSQNAKEKSERAEQHARNIEIEKKKLNKRRLCLIIGSSKWRKKYLIFKIKETHYKNNTS